MIALVQIPNSMGGEKSNTDTGMVLPFWVVIVWIVAMLILAVLLWANKDSE